MLVLATVVSALALAAPPEAAAVATTDTTVPAAAGTPSPLESAAWAELTRSVEGLHLADAPAPYLVAYDLLDGRVVNAFAEQGALVTSGDDPYRNARVEVRVGSPELDSSNFEAFGEPEGVVQKRLPVEDSPVALRRELWLATDSAYKFAVEQLSRKIAARRDDPTPRPPDRSPAPPVVANLGSAQPVATLAQVEGLAQRLSAELATFGGVEVAQAIARDWQGTRTILTNEGTRLTTPTGYFVLRVEGTARFDDGSSVTDARSWVVRTVADLPPEDELKAGVRDLGTWLEGLTTAPVEEDYLGPVLFEGPASTDLFSQLLASELSGTPPADQGGGMIDGPNVPTARLGRRLLPQGWTVVDDPTTDAPVLGRYAYDQEGVAPRRVELVKDGVVRDLLMSRIPRKDLKGSTGHARSLGNDRRVAVPGVVTVTPRHGVSEARLRRAGLRLAADTGRDYLLVVRRITPAALTERLDIGVSGEGPLPGLTTPYEVYRLYADGHQQPVRSVRFSGVDRRVLRDIALAGDNTGPVDILDGPPGPARFQIGPTGGLPTTWDVPAVLVTEVELVGSPGGEPRAMPMPPRGK